MKTFFKLSLLTVLLINTYTHQNLKASHHRYAAPDPRDAAAAMNATNAFGLGFATGMVPAVVGSVVHYGALQSGVSPKNAAISGLVGGGLGGLIMRATRGEAISQAFGPQYRAVSSLGAMTSLVTFGATYWALLGGGRAALASAEEKAAQEAKYLLYNNRGR